MLHKISEPNKIYSTFRSERGEKYGKRSSGFERRDNFDSPYRGESRNYDRADRPRDRDEERHDFMSSSYFCTRKITFLKK